jgi:hypothetical protein
MKGILVMVKLKVIKEKLHPKPLADAISFDYQDILYKGSPFWLLIVRSLRTDVDNI